MNLNWIYLFLYTVRRSPYSVGCFLIPTFSGMFPYMVKRCPYLVGCFLICGKTFPIFAYLFFVTYYTSMYIIISIAPDDLKMFQNIKYNGDWGLVNPNLRFFGEFNMIARMFTELQKLQEIRVTKIQVKGSGHLSLI